MHYDSHLWNHKDGVCTRHMLPSVPCPACMADIDGNRDHLYMIGDSGSPIFESPDDYVHPERIDWSMIWSMIGSEWRAGESQ